MDHGFIKLDTKEQKREYNEYIEQKSHWCKVEVGDTLTNGLIVTDAETGFTIEGTNGYVLSTRVALTGETTLTGTIFCFQEENDPMGIMKGDLFFYPSSDNTLVPMAYSVNLRTDVDENSDVADTVSNEDCFYLGNINDIDSGFADLFKDEYTNVEVTLKNIILECNESGSTRISSANIVDLRKS